MEAGAIALVQVKTEEGVAVPIVAASQSVPLVLPNIAGRGEQTHAARDEEVVFEIRLERFVGYLSPVHVHCVEADSVVLAVKWILSVRIVIIIIIIIKRLLWRQYPRKIRAQWRNKTKGLGILVTMYNAKSRQLDGGAKKLKRIGHYRCSTAPEVSAECRGTGSRACATERLRERSTLCSRRTASDT